LTQIIHGNLRVKRTKVCRSAPDRSRCGEDGNALIRIDSYQALYEIDGADSTGRDTIHYRSDGTVVVYDYIEIEPTRRAEGIREVEEYSLRCSIVNHYYIFEPILYWVKHSPLISDLTKIVDRR
jgi:hypothetical protein